MLAFVTRVGQGQYANTILVPLVVRLAVVMGNVLLLVIHQQAVNVIKVFQERIVRRAVMKSVVETGHTVVQETLTGSKGMAAMGVAATIYERTKSIRTTVFALTKMTDRKHVFATIKMTVY
jgi:hypothetical protein